MDFSEFKDNLEECEEEEIVDAAGVVVFVNGEYLSIDYLEVDGGSGELIIYTK